MRMASIWVRIAALVIALGLLLPAGTASAQLDFFDLLHPSERSEGHYTMRDRADGSVLLRTARILHVGNEFIDRNNRHFRVTSIEEDIAWAELVGETPWTGARDSAGAAGDAIPVQQGEQPKIGVYHSHGAESYVPEDGAESIDEGGGIINVGETFASALQRLGFAVTHEKETHVPHDAGAYHRSRRTAEDLLVKEDKDYLFDVHRDAVPPEEYEEEVDGEKVTQILLVVGQQNQNADSNFDFAQGLKNVADERYPGLVKGILGAEGSYNQDLLPRAMLLEVGAHENSKEDAKKGITRFADVVSEYATGVDASPGQTGRSTRIAASSALQLLLVLITALFVYLLIAAGGWEQFKLKAASFFKREFADVRRGFERKKGDDDRDRS